MTQHHLYPTIVTSLLLLLTSSAQASTPEIRQALLKLYPVYAGADLLREYADECEPTARADHQAQYDRWLQTHRLVGVRDLLRQTLGPQEYSTIEQGEQQTLRPQLRKTLPNCINSATLTSLYNEKIDPNRVSSSSLTTLQAALQDPNSNPAPTPKPPTPKPPTPKPPTQPNPPNTAAAAAALESIYLNQTTGYGVGGGVSVDFDSYAIFQDGTISSDLNAAIGGVGKRNPKRWGQWQRNGNGFKVTWDSGKTQTLGGKLFYKTFPATSSDTLQGRYLSIGGGGNTALGGNVLTASWKTFTFYADGRFEQGGSKQGGPDASGNYSLNNHRIELRYNNGPVIQTGFYFFPSKGQKTDQSIAIGNDIFARQK